jgi:hypothetical protein
MIFFLIGHTFSELLLKKSHGLCMSMLCTRTLYPPLLRRPCFSPTSCTPHNARPNHACPHHMFNHLLAHAVFAMTCQLVLTVGALTLRPPTHVSSTVTFRPTWNVHMTFFPCDNLTCEHLVSKWTDCVSTLKMNILIHISGRTVTVWHLDFIQFLSALF